MKFESTVTEILNVTQAVIDRHGFISSKASKESGVPATSVIVKDIVRYPKNAEAHEVDVPTDFPEIVNDVYEWMLTLAKSKNEYLRVLANIALQEAVADGLNEVQVKNGGQPLDLKSFKFEDKRNCKYRFGVLVSAIPSYYRAKEREVIQKAKADEAQALHGASEHFGEEKQRMDLTDVKLVEVRHIAKMDCMVHTFKHGDNIITIFGSQALGAVGDEYDFRATVVRHTEFQGVKQTQMNRIKIAQHRGMQKYD